MKVKISPCKQQVASLAAEQAATTIRDAIKLRGSARIIVATGASQFDFLAVLVSLPDINWKAVEMFHLDEYVGLPDTAPASFCKYLRERLIEPAGIEKYHLLSGTRDPHAVIDEVTEALRSRPIDVAFVGIGENGHLAFNDPPADFETDDAYQVVTLDAKCRQQQLGEGWFDTLEDVPRQAISMTVRQILKSGEIIAVVPDIRKAAAVKACLEGDVSPLAPSSILRTHANTTIYLDSDSASLLIDQTRTDY